MKPSPDRTTVAGLLLLIGLGLAWGVFSVRSTAQAAAAAAQAHEAQQVLTLLAELQGASAEAEAAQRGFALNGDATLLAAQERARAGTEPRLAALRDALAREPEQFTRLVGLGPLLTRHDEALAAAVELRRRNAPAASQLAAAADARRHKDRVDAAIEEMLAPAQASAAAALARSQTQARVARWTLAVGATALVVCAALLWLQRQRQRQLRRHAEAERDADRHTAQQAGAVMVRLFDLMPEAMGVFDEELRFVRVNAGAAALWGWPVEALRGRPLAQVLAPEDQRRAEQAFTAWLGDVAETTRHSQRTRCKRQDGTLVQVQWHAARLAADAQLLFIAVDVSEVETLRARVPQLAAAAEHADAAAAQAAAAAASARQLRAEALASVGATLLPAANNVLLHAQVLADGLAGSLTNEQDKHARSMRDTALLLQRYGEELRALGQAESGGLELAREAFDVWEAVHKVAATLRTQAEMKGLALELKLADDLGYARGDAARFERVLHQLLDWAIGHSEAGRITVAAALPGAGRLQLVVSDSGQGGAVDTRARVLDLFAQDPALPQPLGHAGELGLALARRIAHAMGGTLVAEGRAEATIRFVLTLPSDTLGA